MANPVNLLWWHARFNHQTITVGYDLHDCVRGFDDAAFSMNLQCVNASTVGAANDSVLELLAQLGLVFLQLTEICFCFLQLVDHRLGERFLALDFLQAGQFDPLAFYRAGRVQIDGFEDIGQPGFVDPSPDAKPPFGGAPGDFFFCAKEVFERLGGFREDLAFSNTHMDSILNLHMFDELKRAHKIGVTYHLRHERDLQSARRLDFDFGRVNATPQPDYGLVDAVETPLGSAQITQLRIPASLEAQARNKAPVEPWIPEYLRREPPPGLLERVLTRMFKKASPART